MVRLLVEDGALAAADAGVSFDDAGFAAGVSRCDRDGLEAVLAAALEAAAQRLARTAVELLALVAVHGRELSFSRLVMLAGLAENRALDAVEELLRTGFAREGRQGLGITCASPRHGRAALALLSAAQRQQLATTLDPGDQDSLR